MKMRVFSKIVLCLAVSLVLAAGWVVSKQYQRERMRGPLIQAVLAQNSAGATRLLALGADANTRDVRRPRLTLWQTLLAQLPFRHRHPSRQTLAPTLLMLAATGARLDSGCSDYPQEDLRYIDTFDNSGPSGICAVHDQSGLVQTLLEHGANANAAGEDGWTALMFACRAGNLQAARLLLDRGAALNVRDSRGNTPFSLAVDTGSLPLTTLLLDRDRGTLVNGKSLNDLLASSITREDPPETDVQSDPNHVALVSLLLARGANANALALRFDGDTPSTPLIYAVTSRRTGVAALLLNHGADVNGSDGTSDGTDGMPDGLEDTPLACAAANDDIPMATLLLKRGANIDGDTARKLTPLTAALFTESFDMVDFLVDVGADVNHVDRNGMTPLMLSRSSPEVTRLLLAHGAKVNAREYDGTTALMMAAKGYDTADSVRVLLAQGANPAARDSKGRTALMMATYPAVRAALLRKPIRP